MNEAVPSTLLRLSSPSSKRARISLTPLIDVVFVKPTEGVPPQRMVEVLDRLAAAGVSDLTLIREPRTD